MAEQRVQRRLAAILAADVVGYSRLMGEDEAGTRARFNAHLGELIEPAIANRLGRIVKITGDALLVEFASVVDAVICGVEIQKKMAERNADEPDDRRIVFRIGVNLGDVIIEGDDIHGDGVNVAARLETLADPGGVVVSGKVHEEVRTKLDLGFDDLGSKEVKNIVEPVRAYRVRLQGGTAAASGEPLPLPDKPSIAVLPFENMSGDTEQEYFADGLAEDVITALSKISKLAVIARNSTFVYKGTATDVRRIAEDLGVRYVLEGSVRSSGKRLRVSAQLINATDGRHVWAERYDRVAEDLFDLQDEITKEIVTALRVQLSDGEEALVWNRGTKNVEAWRAATEATAFFLQWAPAPTARARELANRAIELDPDYAHAWSVAAMCDWYMARIGTAADAEVLIDRAAQNSSKALSLDDTVSWAHFANSLILGYRRDFDAAIDAARHAVALQPGNAEIRAGLGGALVHGGQPVEGLRVILDALSLNPHAHGGYRLLAARAYDMLGDMDRALEESRIAALDIAFGANLNIACLLARKDRVPEARIALAEALRLNPQFTLSDIDRYLWCLDGDYVATVTDGLRKAGLPE